LRRLGRHDDHHRHGHGAASRHPGYARAREEETACSKG
jgi:hypothetical protein